MPARDSAVYLSTALPLPSFGGSYMRAAETARALHQRFDVTVIFTGDASPGEIQQSQDFLTELGVKLVVAPHQVSRPIFHELSLAVRIVAPIAHNLVLRRPPRLVSDLLERASLIWVHRLFPLWNWKLCVTAPLVLDLDDLDENTKTNLPQVKRLLITRLIRVTRRRQLRLASIAVVNSEVDRARLKTSVPLTIMPNTYSSQHSALPMRSRTLDSGIAVMIARFDYWPNAEGAQWLIDRVWPLVTAALPHATLRIIGRDGQRLILADDLQNVTVCGEVADLHSELERAAVSLVPIFHGSGTRIKILESFANHIPVVSTPLGAEGLDVQVGLNILLADDAAQFAHAIIEVLTHTERTRHLAEEAFRVYEMRYSPRVFARTVSDIVDKALGN